MSGPLEDFFTQFADLGFRYRRRNTAQHNFKRLSETPHLAEYSLAAVRVNFHDALVQQFNHDFGTGADLESWQKLCVFIDIPDVPHSIEECRKLVWDAHVNIVDLLECVRTGKRVHKFATLEELRRYTRRPGKMFPKESAYAGDLLKELLREIVNPYYGKRTNGSQKRKRRRARKQAEAEAQS